MITHAFLPSDISLGLSQESASSHPRSVYLKNTQGFCTQAIQVVSSWRHLL